MALPKFYKVCQDQQGNIVPQVLCSVFNHGTAVLASLYNDDAGTVPLSNPMTSDAQYGSIKFYVNPGHYDLTFTKPGYTFEPIDDLQVPQDVLTLGTMAQQNASAVAITGGTATLQTATIGGSPAGAFALNVFPWKAFASQLAVGDGASVALLGGYKSLIYGPALHQHNKASAQHGLTMQAVGADAGAFTQLFLNAAGTPIGSISTTGAATAFNTSSDVRLKEGIAALTGALDVVRALRPVRFRWRADDSAGQGFLAHEVQALVPEAVTGEPDAVDGDGQIVPQQMDHAKLVVWLVGAVQELAAQVAALATRLEEAGA